MLVSQPVFILASPFSFTSIVCAMLGQHPAGYAVPEINLFVSETIEELVLDMMGKRQILMHGLLRTIAQLYTGEQTIESIDLARRWLKKRFPLTSGEVYWELCKKVAPLRIIDKSPIYSNPQKPEILDRITRTFPNAHYLYLLRHPRTQGQSWLKIPTAPIALIELDSLDYSTTPPTIDPQYAWYSKQKIILEFLATIPEPQKMQLRGEDILNNPRLYLEKICQWLNLPFDENIYQTMLRTEESSYACMGPYGAQWGNNPGYQKSPTFQQRPVKNAQLSGPLPWRNDNTGFLPEVIELAQFFGYE